QFRDQNLPLAQKMGNLWLRIRRALLLSGPGTIGKIAAAAAERAVFTPAEEAVGSAWSKIPGIAKIAAMAPRHGGGFSTEAEAGALVDTVGKGVVDSWKTLKGWKEGQGGQSDLDALYHPQTQEQGWLELPGVLHAALKAPIKR